jgi:hypothetical protein
MRLIESWGGEFYLTLFNRDGAIAFWQGGLTPNEIGQMLGGN